jgi:stage II sporulation protein D
MTFFGLNKNMMFNNFRMNRIKTFLKLTFLLNFALASYGSISKNAPTTNKLKVKVRIAKNLKTLEFSGTDLSRHLHPVKQKKVYSGRKRIKFNCDNFSQDNSLDKSILLASLKSATGLTTFGKSKYQGDLHVVASSRRGSCDVVNELDMDYYISSLLSKEMNASWPIEALKAQAIAARTYALDKMKKSRLTHESFFDLENSEKHQVNGDFFDVTDRTLKAAKDTSGMVLTDSKGKLVPAFFHASCGGHTYLPSDVWTNSVRSYKGVNCNYCKKKENWQSIVTRGRFAKFLAWAAKKKYIRTKQKDFKNFVIYTDNIKNKTLSVNIGKKVVKIRKAFLRRYFGRVQFPSINFYLVDGNDNGPIQMVGKGNGHGVGLCQVGSKGLADQGWDYQRILSHYFPKMQLRKIY